MVQLRVSQKFLPSFKFKGNCSYNSIPSHLKISFTQALSNERLIEFNIADLPQKKIQVIWMIDHILSSIDKTTNQKLMTPGQHYVESFLIDKRGYYRHLSSFVNVL
jgi:hypothetical protein